MPEAGSTDVVVLEVIGEGKTDIGADSNEPRRPDRGVLPILVHRVCNKPNTMRVKTRRFAHLQGKRLWQKVWFAKRQASYNRGTAGVVFVLDTEGELEKRDELAKGRDHGAPEFPMAIGVAHPCIEAWLLTDAATMREVLRLPRTPELPEQPESLPADNREHMHPKRVLADMGAVSQVQKDRLMLRMDLEEARKRCSISLEPFTLEVEARLRPLFPNEP